MHDDLDCLERQLSNESDEQENIFAKLRFQWRHTTKRKKFNADSRYMWVAKNRKRYLRLGQ